MSSTSLATALLAALSVVHILPTVVALPTVLDTSPLAANTTEPYALNKRAILRPLPENADSIELRYQPFLDFDKDGCYQTAAIDSDGNLNPGLRMGGDLNGHCRDEVQLDNSNTYVRRRCNNGFCGIIYEYYYEKDQKILGGASGGHTHDFENVIVFTGRNGEILRVAPSCHGDYKQARTSDIPRDGDHPLIVYHKDGIKTHCHRFANNNDIAKPENHKGRFFRAPLVGWLGWPSAELRDKMNNHNWGGEVSPKTREAQFAEHLKKAGAESIGLNPYIDA